MYILTTANVLLATVLLIFYSSNFLNVNLSIFFLVIVWYRNVFSLPSYHWDCLCCGCLFISEDSLNELNAKGIKKLHNFMRREEEKDAW